MFVARAAALVLAALVSALCLQLSAQTPAPSPKKAAPPAPARPNPQPAARPASPASQLRAMPSLGAVSFPNSGAPAAQDAFLRGLAWLHSFGYEEAIDAFRAAQKTDPGFAMAYWGEAMSFNQPLWFHEDVESGRAALRKLGATPAERLAKARTPREQGYLAAVEASVRRRRQARARPEALRGVRGARREVPDGR